MQGLLPAAWISGASVLLGIVFGGAPLGLPGFVEPVPAIRIFPAVLAVAGGLVLLEPWSEHEITGARPVLWHRSRRFLIGAMFVGTAGYSLDRGRDAAVVTVLALVLFSLVAGALGFLGRFWWLVVALGIYGQLFVASFDRVRLGTLWAVGALVVALCCYLVRGDRGASRHGR